MEHMDCFVSNPAEWRVMQQLGTQLPRLRTVHFTGRRSWYKMYNAASLQSPPSMQHLPVTSLVAASFEGTVRGLQDIAALAPQLQQLYCSKLVLPRNQQELQPAQLSHLTHFGSEVVHVDAEDAEEAAAAFAAAFPALQVMMQTPEFGRNLTLSDHIHKTRVPLREVLSKCSTVHSLRVFGSTTDMGGFLAQQLQDLEQIERVSVHGIGPAAELTGLSQLKQLRSLRLSFELPAKRAATHLLAELELLPQLQLLALPAKLLCGLCCPSMGEAVDRLVGRCVSRGCRVVFLQRPLRQGSKRQQAGDYCPNQPVVRASFERLLSQAASVVHVDLRQEAAAGVAGSAPARGAESTTGLPVGELQMIKEVQGQLQLCMLLPDEWQYLPLSSSSSLEAPSCSDSRVSSGSTWDVFKSVGEWVYL